MDGGVDQGPWLQERVGGGVGAMAVAKKGEGWGLVGPKRSKSREGVREGLAWRSGGGARASVAGVSGRDTGPRDGANFATCVVFLLFLMRKKEEKWRCLKDALWGGGGVPTAAGLVDGGVDQVPWLQERVGLGCSKEEQVQGRGQGRVGLAVGGGARASVAGGVGGRGTGPTEQISQRVSHFCSSEKKKNGFF